jgi:hypothetical protein
MIREPHPGNLVTVLTNECLDTGVLPSGDLIFPVCNLCTSYVQGKKLVTVMGVIMIGGG